MSFYWWDDAIAFAFSLSRVCGVRARVYRGATRWLVDLAEEATA